MREMNGGAIAPPSVLYAKLWKFFCRILDCDIGDIAHYIPENE